MVPLFPAILFRWLHRFVGSRMFEAYTSSKAGVSALDLKCTNETRTCLLMQ